MLIIRTLLLGIITWSVAVLGKQVFPVITDPTAILYKGTVGTLPCRYQRGTSMVTWYKGKSLQEDARFLLFVGIRRNGDLSRSGPGFIEDSFDITDDYSLIIKHVKVADEGRYYCEVVDLEKEVSYNYTDLSVIAFASWPVIEPCVMKEGQLHTGPPSCTYDASNHTRKLNLTCTLSGFKPDVSLSWRSCGEDLERMDSTEATLLADGTLERRVTVEFDPRNKGKKNFTCTAVGIAVNGTVSTSVTILSQEYTVAATETAVPVNWQLLISGCLNAGLFIIIAVMIAREMRQKTRVKSELPTRHGDNALSPLLGGTERAREWGERFNDLAKVMMGRQRLSFHQRHLLKEVCYNLVNVPRTLLKNFDYGKKDCGQRGNDRGDREPIEIQLKGICVKVVQLVDTVLQNKPSDDATADEIEEYVFYLAMKGDYNRYMSSCKFIENRTSFIDKAKKAYEEAMVLCTRGLHPAHNTRLAISVKLSVFNFETLHNCDEACQLARMAIKNATERQANNDAKYDPESLYEDLSSERVPYMLALHKYLEYWTTDRHLGQGVIHTCEFEEAVTEGPHMDERTNVG